MEPQSLTNTSDKTHHHHPQQQAQWSRLVRRNTVPRPVPGTPPPLLPPQLHTLDLLPSILPQQSSLYQARLEQYNSLISSRAKVRLHTPPLPAVLSSPAIVKAAPVSRSGSTPAPADRDRHKKDSAQRGHGNKNAASPKHGEQTLMTPSDTPASTARKMEGSKPSPQTAPRPVDPRSSSTNNVPSTAATTAPTSSSVPTTPRHRGRQFSFGSREPSPTLPQNHSPRSVYSESSSTLPSLRLPPRAVGGCRYETAMAHSKRRMPYSIGGDWLDTVQLSTIKDRLTGEEDDRLTKDMTTLYEQLLPRSESDAKRERFVQKLENLLNGEWPGHDIRVHMFGSSGNMLCTNDSDVDICITTTWKDLENVCMLAELLAKHGMEKVICVSTAKVPIVKIWDPELSLACDMNVNNTLAMENTRMIKTYVQIDDRVRPLAMIIKHWTRRRIVNDAGFGGTLSSYTWICMIINFLQTRNPPILPALHEEPHISHAKMRKDTAFADDLDKLRGFGDTNKETLGELLFHFFRYYGYELDYDKYALSVRSGKLIPKVEKGWHVGISNHRLCVEEPFNTGRNLGNTADETSFRGLHTELRRAFDLISESKFHDCCEEFVYPKEEERPFIRPQQSQTKVVMSRSSSQSNRGRGGFRGRHGHRSGSNNRRASSGTYDNPSYMPQSLPPGLNQQDSWIQAQNSQNQLHNDIYTTLSVLQAQENSLRLQLYTQSQAYAHAQAQAFAQMQRLQASGGNGKQFSDRDRGNSFDAPPLTAPIRPDMYFYPLQYATGPVYGHHSPTGFPSSPSMTPTMPELRRSLHRTTVAGSSSNVASSSLRSHSQPAARSVPAATNLQGSASAQGTTPVHMRHSNGIPIPNFIADENLEMGCDESQTSDSPQDDTVPKEYLGYYGNGSPSTGIRRQNSVPPMMAIPAFGDLQEGDSRRRLSAEQFPQAIFDRLRRTSRSPSPLGHGRAFSSGPHSNPLNKPLQQSVSAGNLYGMHDRAPMVVNGSTYASDTADTMSQLSIGDTSSYDDCGYPYEQVYRGESLGLEMPQMYAPHLSTPKDVTHPRFPTAPVVNGTADSSTPAGSHEQQVAPKNRAVKAPEAADARSGHKNTQTGGVTPLDINASQAERLRDEISHLSPVLETRSPSPTTNRKFEPRGDGKAHGSAASAVAKERTDSSNSALKLAITQNMSKTHPPRPNGHVKGAKSESGIGSWQQITKSKRKGQNSERQTSGSASRAEAPPKNSAERKGG